MCLKGQIAQGVLHCWALGRTYVSTCISVLWACEIKRKPIYDDGDYVFQWMNHKMSKATSISFLNSAILYGLLIYIQQFTGQNDKNN